MPAIQSAGELAAIRASLERTYQLPAGGGPPPAPSTPQSGLSRFSGRISPSGSAPAPTLSPSIPGQSGSGGLSPLGGRLGGVAPTSSPNTLRINPLPPRPPGPTLPPSVVPPGSPPGGALGGFRLPPGGTGAIAGALGRLGGITMLGGAAVTVYQNQIELNRLWGNLLFPDPPPPPGPGPSFHGPAVPSPIVPPAGPGSSVGVPYKVVVSTTVTRNDGKPDGPVGTFVTEYNVTGPVRGIYVDKSDPEYESLYLKSGSPDIFISTARTDTYGNTASVIEIERLDGGTDPIEGPAPAPGSRSAPGVQPAGSSQPAPAASPGSVAAPSLAPSPTPGRSGSPGAIPGGAPGTGPGMVPGPSSTPGNQGNPGDGGAMPFGIPGGVPPAAMLGGLSPGLRGGAAPPAAPAPIPPDSPNPTPRPGAQPQPGGRPPIPTPEPPTPFCRYQSYLDQQILLNTNNANLVLNTVSTVQLFNLDSKLGPQIPNGGISGVVQKTSQLLGKTWNFLQVDRVLNVLTWIGVLHNAYMLSNNLAITLFSAVGNVLDAIGIEKEDGSPLDVGAMVSRWTDGFFKSIFGVQTVEGIKAEWKKVNRIYQAATNILNSMQSIMYSVTESLEIIGNYVAWIGNAAKRAGVVAESAYRWMNPNLNFRSNRFFRGLETATETVEMVDIVASEVINTQEQVKEINKNTQELKKLLEGEDKDPKPTLGSPENKPQATAEKAEKASSQSPVIPREAEVKPEA